MDDGGMKRVIVCGSRNWHERSSIEQRLAALCDDFGTCEITIVHGAAKGADRIAEQEAQKLGYMIEAHPYRRFISGEVSATKAPLVRNRFMASRGADLCVAFWDGESTGTAHMVQCARDAGIPVHIVRRDM